MPSTIHLRNRSLVPRTLAIGLAVLGLCVFAWGLKYKLSLYDPPRAVSHHIPAAKLLSDKDWNTALLVVASRSTNSVVPLALVTLTFVWVALAGRRSFLRSCGLLLSPSRPPAPEPIVLSPASFVRPPPRLR